MTRRARALLAALAALAVLVTGGAAGAQADPDPGTGDPPAEVAAPADPFDRLAACVGAEGRLLVVLLVDESASLRETDPDDQRVAAARAALRSIDLLRGTDAGGGSVAIDVLVSTFSFDFAEVDGWSPLTAETRGAVDDRIAGLADRDESMDTDFHNALDGARRALADRATESAGTSGGNVCKAILLFTDGSYTLGPRTTAEQRERFGTTKTYAPGVVLDSEEAASEATREGVTALCREGGVADQVRADRITLVSVPLGEGSGLLEALTTGESEERTCGDPGTDTPGAYLPAPDTDELLRTFDLVASRIGGGSPLDDPLRAVPCEDDVCDEAAVGFAVSPSFRRIHVFAAVPGDGSRVVLRPPEGDEREIAPDEAVDEDVAGVPVTARWIAERAVVIDLEVPDDGTGAGEWQVALVGREGETTGVLQVVTFSDLVARLSTGSTLLLGGAQELTATIATRDGDEATEELRDPRVTATLVDPITGAVATVELVPGEDGFTGGYTVPAEVTSSALRASVRLEATTAGGAPLTSVAPEVVLPVRRPEGYPQVAPPVVELSPIVGEDSAEGTITFVAGSGDEGCAWVEDLTVEDGPEGSGALVLGVEGVGRGEDDCTPVDGPLAVTLDVEAEDRASGSVVGHLRVVLARADGEAPIPTDIPVTFEMARGIDEGKRLALAAGLLLGGLLAPLALLLVINLLTTRFPALGHVRGARVPVVVDTRGELLRSDGGSRSVWHLGPEDFASLEGLGAHRRFTWGGLVFRARTSVNPFAEPYATVVPEEGTADVSREGRRSDLDLGLVGSWIFLLDQGASRAARPGEVHGVVVAFASEAGVQRQADRLAGDLRERGPALARRLARLAQLPAG